MAEIIVAKNRMGQIGWVKCKFEGQYSKFSDEERNLYDK
jgi:replicative DNA helicase